MTVLNRWLTRLAISDRSRRAITEAALDWRHEVATAKTFWNDTPLQFGSDVRS